jgi:putative phosphoesterase
MALVTGSVRVLLLSDTHGRLHPEILALTEDADCVVHAGDVGHPDVLAALAGAGRQVIAVRGNNDTPGKWPMTAREIPASLAEHGELSLPGGMLVVEHGDRVNPAARRHELLRARYPDARLILYGHSHRQLIDDGIEPWVVNPGAAGRSRTYGASGCVLLTAGGRRWALRAFRFPLEGWGK